MRVSPAIRVKGRIGREVPEVRNLSRPPCKTVQSGPAACLHDRYVDFSGALNLSTSRTWSGLSSNDGKGFRNWVSDPLPARSDGPDNVDGGPDAGDITPPAFRSKGKKGLARWLTRRKCRPAGAFRQRPVDPNP